MCLPVEFDHLWKIKAPAEKEKKKKKKPNKENMQVDNFFPCNAKKFFAD